MIKVLCLSILVFLSAFLPAGTREPPTLSAPPEPPSWWVFGGSGAEAPGSLTALHRSGQTFLTWSERSDLRGEYYRIYRSAQPLSGENLSQARLLYEVGKGSATFYANRYNRDGSGEWQYRYLERYVIADGGSPLSAGTGLLVWTLSAADFSDAPSGGEFYYAVTVLPQGGSESLLSVTALPLIESIADPQPVRTGINIGAGGHLYIQYMPLHAWNPSFHAPNPLNNYYGLNPDDPVVASAVQYAYDYAVYAPTPDLCGGSLPASLPVFISLHGWGDNTYAPLSSHPDPYWCAYAIYPVDMGETWYFGFARQHDYRLGGETPGTGGEPAAGDRVFNFTEQRILRMLYDLERDPPGVPVDAERAFVYGHSMGGSGALALALRYPNVFAAAYASEPMTDYTSSGDGGGIDWRGDLSPKWGSRALNLPVQIDAPAGWAVSLTRFNGSGVWDWQNHQANLQTRVQDEMVPLGMAHGQQDTTIEWATQGKPVYAAANAGGRVWGGAVTAAEHTWLSFNGLPPTLGLNSSLAPFVGFAVKLHETMPGLANASADLSLPPPDSGSTGGYNQTIAWSSSWDAWDGAPLDTPTAWRISLRTTDSSNQTVDVTPRRRQRFQIIAGAAYSWENRRVSDNRLIASGSLIASSDGLIRVREVAISAQGSRLIIQAQAGIQDHHLYLPLVQRGSPITSARRPWPDTTSGIHVFKDQIAPYLNDAQWRFAASHYAGTQKMLRSDADRLRAINPNFLILHYRLGLGLGNRAIQNGCAPTGNWLAIIEGNQWVQEWPGDALVKPNWFFNWPPGSAQRVLNCDWGWYLINPDDPDYRVWWQAEALRQLQANADDGLFMDSVSVPNYLGATSYVPGLPEVDATFENAWSNRIHTWLEWLKSQAVGSYSIIPNVGSWITSRDATDYSPADGVMIEGFAIEADQSPYLEEDWLLQMNRILGLAGQGSPELLPGKIILGQSYATGARERMFAVGSYLLVKGSRTFITIEQGAEPEWWPEYDLPVGAPLGGIPASMAELYDSADQVYRRAYTNGIVLVNPSPSETREVALGGNYRLAVSLGGGIVPASGIPTGSLSYQVVSQVSLPPYSAMVLLE